VEKFLPRQRSQVPAELARQQDSLTTGEFSYLSTDLGVSACDGTAKILEMLNDAFHDFP